MTLHYREHTWSPLTSPTDEGSSQEGCGGIKSEVECKNSHWYVASFPNNSLNFWGTYTD
uniref:Uncharacterized protein n=1 Tax=Anguilla anguilla TaxID=7936 RepID=A0A0E9R0E9_ANGAN